MPKRIVQPAPRRRLREAMTEPGDEQQGNWPREALHGILHRHGAGAQQSGSGQVPAFGGAWSAPTPAGSGMSSVRAPLRLTDAQMATVTTAARQLPWASRSGFLRQVAQELRGHADPDDGRHRPRPACGADRVGRYHKTQRGILWLSLPPKRQLS
jgi:hypothetical protein